MNHVLPVLMDSVMYSSWLFIIAVGLTLIYGVMKILNVAHGSMYALGAYVSASLVGYWIGHGHAVAGSYLMLLLAAILVGVAAGPALFLSNAGLNAMHSKPATRWVVWLACGIGYIWLWQISTSNSARVMWLLPLVAILAWPAISKRVFRIIYGSDETVLMLLTYAVFLILEDVVKLIWGVESYYLSDPYNLLGGVQFGEQTYSWYDIARALVAVGIGVAMAAALRYTRSGRLLIAVIHDREISQAMGINVYRFYAVTFTIGAMLAAIGGALTAPTVSVVPGMGVEVIVLAFAVVVTGGLGSLAGAALGATIVGVVRSVAVHHLPEFELFSIYVVMALVLIFRPKGLISGSEVRRI